MTQSTSRSSLNGSSASVVTQCSHMSSARCSCGRQALLVGVAQRPGEVLGLDVEGRHLAAVGEPHLLVQVRSWLMSRMARIGFSSVMSRRTTDGSSSMRSSTAVAPTLRKVVYSLMFESPTITWRRR